MSITPSEKLLKFFATSTPSFYRKGDIVLHTGAARSGAFFIKKGYIKDSTFSEDGREFTLFIFKPHDLFSYAWIFSQIPNIHSFRAMSDCTVYEKSREGLLLFLEQNPDVHFMITQSIVTRMRGLMIRMEHMAFGNASQKISSIIYILAERFGKESKRGTIIPIRLTQKDIAELIGVSRETSSIEIKKLLDLNILERSGGNYVVVKQKKLQELSSLFS